MPKNTAAKADLYLLVGKHRDCVHWCHDNPELAGEQMGGSRWRNVVFVCSRGDEQKAMGLEFDKIVSVSGSIWDVDREMLMSLVRPK